MVGLALIIVGIFAFQPSRKIEVMLSDDYPAIELLENYKVIEQKEGIYTLEPLKKVDEQMAMSLAPSEMRGIFT